MDWQYQIDNSGSPQYCHKHDLIPFSGVWIATIIIMLRSGLGEVFGNSASALINRNTDSKYRATTLSTYLMLSRIPYVIAAYYLGVLMELWSVNWLILWLGLMLGEWH